MRFNAFMSRCKALGVPPPPGEPTPLSRRGFLSASAAALLACAAPIQAAPTPMVDPDFWRRPRELWVKRMETREEARAVYWADGEYLTEGYVQLCWLMRDVRAKQAVQMDRVLLNVMTGLQAYYAAYGITGPLVLTSGFRTVETNNRLLSEGAARNSMHLYGRAVDLTLPGISVEHLGKVKQYLHGGGLGFYPTKHFIHIDTGRTRTWHG